MTVLAKRFQTARPDGLFLRAMNQETMAFTERNWRSLTLERNWPPQTPPGELQQLRWELQTENRVQEIQMIDFAGETFREIFGKYDMANADIYTRSAQVSVLGPLLKYLNETDAVVLLVNLRDFINDQDFTITMETQWALRGALDYLFKRNVEYRKIAVVLTQIDQYAELVEGRSSWKAIIEEHLPHTQIVQSYPNIHYYGISAVYETAVETAANGTAMIRPADNFQSLYLEDLVRFFDGASTLASRRSRAFASLLDFAICVCVVLLYGILFESIVPHEGVFGVYGGIFSICCLNSYLLIKRGQTIGKIAFKIKVVDRITGGNPGALRIAGVRYLAFIAIFPMFSIAGVYGCLAALLISGLDPFFIFRGDRRCLHDLVANTIVVPVKVKRDT